MRKFIVLSTLIFLSSPSTSFAQNISAPADSVQNFLCKKWEVDYAIMGQMKISRLPGATELNYEFFKDKTFLLTSSDAKDKEKGPWIYDAKEKIIRLMINGKVNTAIISLTKEELIMAVDTKKATPDDPMEIKVVYKVKKK